MNNMKRNACQKCAFAVRGDNPHCGLRGFTSSFNVEWCEAEDDKVPNGYELQEDGYFSWVEKKKKYLQSYEECCQYLGFVNNELVFEGDYRETNFPLKQWKRLSFINQFNKLLICRDAYWKIAGEEMGLGKPWEPDWKNDEQFKYIIICRRGCIIKDTYTAKDVILTFPTAEMRDAFYENFKELIEECKELI